MRPTVTRLWRLVSRLAFELGFQDPACFCRFFKRQTGLSPTAYRHPAQQAAG